MEDHIRVAIRVRPLNGKEQVEQANECIVTNSEQILVGEKSFTFDHVFGKHTTQDEIYKKCVSGMVDSFFGGYNTTIFAYGQTGTGKTFTMGTTDISDAKSAGIIPRVVDEMFDRMLVLKTKAHTQKLERIFTIKVSYLEVYNEAVKDLLHPDIPSKNIVVREDSEGGIMVMGMKEESVNTKEELHEHMLNGNLQRTTGATLMNDSSSRSHSIFTIIMEQKLQQEDGSFSPEGFMISKFHLVDLAGSERVKKTGAIGQRLKESVNINSGLLALGNVISALGDTQRKTPVLHVPYRESKLTRLLQDSLGGNSKTLMIACVSPADSSVEESLNTLRYANRARNICNKPIVNRDPHLALLAQLRGELQACKLLLIKHNIPLDDTTGALLPSEVEAIEGDMDNPLSQAVQQLRAQNEALTAEVAQLQSERKQHCCLDVLATEGEDLFASLLEGLAEIADENLRGRLTSLVADMQQRAATAVARPEPVERRAKADPPAGGGKLPPKAEPPRRSTSRGAGGYAARPRSASAVQPAAPGRRASFKRREAPELDADEVLARYEHLQAEYAKLQTHADRLKEDLFQAEWRTVELDSDVQQERAEATRLREEVKELKRTNWKLSRRPPADLGEPSGSGSPSGLGTPSEATQGQSPAAAVSAEHQRRQADAQAAYEANCAVWEADMERMQRERDDLAQMINGITDEKQRLEDQCRQMEQLFLQKQDFHQQNLRSLAETIQEKEQTIRELALREEEAEEMCRRYERKLAAIEEEKHMLQLELTSTLSVLEKANMDAAKKERHRQQLLQEYDMKLKAAEANAQEQRRRLKEKEQQLRQQRLEEAQLRKLRAELAQLREQQDRMKQKVRQEAERADLAKASGAQHVGALRKQLLELERKNRDAEAEKRQKEEELAALKAALHKEKHRADQEKGQLQTRLDKEQQQNLDLERRNRALDRRVELSRQRGEAADKLQRLQLRKEKQLRDRVDAAARRDQLQQQLKEHDWAFTRGLSGWAARIKTLEAELVKRRAMLAKAVAAQNAEKAAALQEAIAKHLTELAETQAKHDHLRSAMTDRTDLVFQQNMAMNIGAVTEALEDLDAALALGDRQIREAEEELRALDAALHEVGDADDAEIESITRAAPASARAHRGAALPPSPRVPALRAVGRHSPNGSPDSLVGSEGVDSASTKSRPTPDGSAAVDYKAMLGKYHALILELKTKESKREQELRELTIAKQEDKETITRLENVVKMMELSHRRQLSRLQELHKAELQRVTEDELETV